MLCICSHTVLVHLSVGGGGGGQCSKHIGSFRNCYYSIGRAVCDLTSAKLLKCVRLFELKEALQRVQPSGKREGFAIVPDVTWQDVGSLDDVKRELNRSILVSDFRSLSFCLKKGRKCSVKNFFET